MIRGEKDEGRERQGQLSNTLKRYKGGVRGEVYGVLATGVKTRKLLRPGSSNFKELCLLGVDPTSDDKRILDQRIR